MQLSTQPHCAWERRGGRASLPGAPYLYAVPQNRFTTRHIILLMGWIEIKHLHRRDRNRKKLDFKCINSVAALSISKPAH